MRTFDTSKNSPVHSTLLDTTVHRTHHDYETVSSVSLELPSIGKESKAFSSISRKDAACQNLAEAKQYLTKQSNGLSQIQETVMLWKDSVGSSYRTRSDCFLFMEPIENILSIRHKSVPLFGDGNEDVLKFHYFSNGQRNFLEVEVVPLLQQPSFSTLRIATTQDYAISSKVLDDCGGEVMTQRIKVDSKLCETRRLLSELSGELNQSTFAEKRDISMSTILLTFIKRTVVQRFARRPLKKGRLFHNFKSSYLAKQCIR